MKRLFVLAIAGIFTVGIAIKLAYGFDASASCWKSGQTNYANAMAGSHGLHDGTVYASASVGGNGSDETIHFGNNFAMATAHASGPFNDAGVAHAAVAGIDDDGEPQMDNDHDDN